MHIYVPLTQIDDNPFQARQEYGDVAELADRIVAARASYPDSYGLMQIPRGRAIFRIAAQPEGRILVPGDFGVVTDQVSVRGKILLDDTAVRIQLAFGHRRLRAFRHLVETAAPGYEDGRFPIHIDALSDEQMLDAVWSENRERKDITAVEEAELLARKLERAKSQREVAEAWGVDRSTVANRLRLLELPAEIQQANREGKLSERACLALAPVVAVQQAANGSVKWGTRREHWGPPVAPADFIAQAINDPKMTSDAIRSYTKQALNHVGQELPGCIADMRAEQGGEILRVSCSGCPKRINTTCLSPACLEAKKEAFKAAAIADAETVLGIPYSDREEDFQFGYDKKGLLKTLWESGQQRKGTSFVIGWRLGESAYRPFVKGGVVEYTGGTQAWEGDGRSPIAIGHRGNLPLHLLPDSEAANLPKPEDIPDWETRQAWIKEVKKYTQEAIKQAKTAVADTLYFKLDGAEDILQAFVCREKDEWLDEYEAVIKAFVKFMWDYSPSVPRYDSMGEFERVVRFLRRAGLQETAVSTGSSDGDRQRRIIFALAEWYEQRDRTWKWPEEGTADALKRPLQAALAECQDETLRHELTRALRDVDTRLEAEAAQEAAVQAKRLAAANLAGDEDIDLHGEE